MPPDDGMNAAARGRTILKLGKFTGLSIDLDRPAMLLDDDVVTDRQAKTGAFPGRFGGEERIEHLFLHLGRNAGAVITNR